MSEWGGKSAEKRAVDVRRRLGQPGKHVYDEFAPDFAKLVDEIVYGGIWARPGLDLHTRSLIVIAVDVAMGRFDFARAHMESARRSGVTVEQVVELAFQVAAYAGMPAGDRTLHIIHEVYQLGEA